MLDEAILIWALLLTAIPASAQQLSIGIQSPNVSIGINLPLYPDLEPVPGYPVYYAPGVEANYFFYDGMYWVYQDDNWYASSWYNGPWGMVGPEFVPVFVLRIPVRYYRRPPVYFRSWQSDAPPRWGDHWGNGWAQRRNGWDRWDRHAVPARPPLPVYQRQYSGDRYPRVERQQKLQSQNYRYQPHDPAVRQQYRAQQGQTAAAPLRQEKHGTMPEAPPRSRDAQRAPSPPLPPAAPVVRQSPHAVDRPVPQHPAEQSAVPQRQHPEQDAERKQDAGRGKDHERDNGRDQDHGR